VVDSVDLTQSPPLLSIGGQTFTVNQIQGIINWPPNRPAPASSVAHPAGLETTDKTAPAASECRRDCRDRGIFKEIRITVLGLGKF